MTTNIRRATPDDVEQIVPMVGELLTEIMNATGTAAFNFDFHETSLRLRDFLGGKRYFVFIAENESHAGVGFLSACESHALYAEGVFGTITELFVRPAFRGKRIGERLVEQARDFASARRWTRLEVTTPPLPEFARTLAFYERCGFAITGGRKLKIALS